MVKRVRRRGCWGKLEKGKQRSGKKKRGGGQKGKKKALKKEGVSLPKDRGGNLVSTGKRVRKGEKKKKLLSLGKNKFPVSFCTFLTSREGGKKKGGEGGFVADRGPPRTGKGLLPQKLGGEIEDVV